MKIAYISDQNPHNIDFWSGTPFHIINALKKQHDVVWIGGGIMNGVMWHQKFLGNSHPKFIQDYSPEMGKALSKELRERHIDIVVSSNYVLCSDLDADIPFIYFNDIVFSVGEEFFLKPSPDLGHRAKYRERKCLRKADAIIYSSEFTKQRAISDYELSETNIQVIEFGAIFKLQKILSLTIMTRISAVWYLSDGIGRKKGGQKYWMPINCLSNKVFNVNLPLLAANPWSQLKTRM